jgi:hypothetical protein
MSDTIPITEENPCIANLSVCEASCCKWMSFEVKTHPKSLLEDYYKKHGCIVDRIDRSRAWIRVPSRCKQLTDEDKCALHGLESKPVLCTRLNKETAQSGYYLTPGCIYKED